MGLGRSARFCFASLVFFLKWPYPSLSELFPDKNSFTFNSLSLLEVTGVNKKIHGKRKGNYFCTKTPRY